MSQLTLTGLVGVIADAARRYDGPATEIALSAMDRDCPDFDAIAALDGAKIRSTVYSPGYHEEEPYVIEVATALFGHVTLRAQRSRPATAEEARELEGEAVIEIREDVYRTASLGGE